MSESGSLDSEQRYPQDDGQLTQLTTNSRVCLVVECPRTMCGEADNSTQPLTDASGLSDPRPYYRMSIPGVEGCRHGFVTDSGSPENVIGGSYISENLLLGGRIEQLDNALRLYGIGKQVTRCKEPVTLFSTTKKCTNG